MPIDDLSSSKRRHGRVYRRPWHAPHERLRDRRSPTVIFEEDDADSWKDFVEHAKAAGAAFITMSEVMLEPEDVATLIGQVRDEDFPDHDAAALDEAQDLMQHAGKIGYLQLGFAHQGVMFLYETATEWYDQFQELMETVSDLGGIIVDERRRRRLARP